jgi:hypothetical protein
MKNPLLWSACALLLLAGCGAPDPIEVDVDGDGFPDGLACRPGAALELPALTQCPPAATDYRPRENGSLEDAWPACISDDNQYHRIQPSISTIARVDAFEQIAFLLWENGTIPSAEDFLEARVLYAQSEGLDSRVQRREDVHYPALPGGAKCSDAGMPDAYPDRCAGPAKLLPVLNEAFLRGAEVEAPLVQAARIEAALVSFLYLSSLSEVMTCTAKPADCDSAWAYYSGGGERAQPLGYGRYLQSVDPDAHDRAYDGTLAVRCWRDLDAGPTATQLDLRDRARDQLDAATLHGLARITMARAAQLPCSTGQFKQAHLEFVRVTHRILDRAIRAADPGAADALAAELEKSAPEVNAARVIELLAAAIPCR